MMDEKSSVDFNTALGLQEEITTRTRIALEKNDVQFFDAVEALLKANYQQKETFIEEVLKRKSLTESFIVEDIFREVAKKLTFQYYLGDKFKIWLLKSASLRKVSVGIVGKNNLKEYILPKKMNDFGIQNTTGSKPMEEDEFWATFYLLFAKPDLGKEILKYELRKDYENYVFHVKISSLNVVAVNAIWFHDGWHIDAHNFVGNSSWSEDVIFLF
jgi:hypothetical protein